MSQRRIIGRFCVLFLFAHEEGADTLAVTVTLDEKGKYEFQAKPVAKNPKGTEIVVSSDVHDGSANPDFAFAHGDAIWGVDARPEESSVVISGNCP